MHNAHPPTTLDVQLRPLVALSHPGLRLLESAVSEGEDIRNSRLTNNQFGAVKLQLVNGLVSSCCQQLPDVARWLLLAELHLQQCQIDRFATDLIPQQL